MKEVNFVLYFGANRGKNALNNPQTVTTHANCDAVTHEKENLFKAIYGYLVELSDMGISYAVNYIDLIDENVPNTNASIVLKFRYNSIGLLLMNEILSIILTNGLSYNMDIDNKIMYIYYKIEK